MPPTRTYQSSREERNRVIAATLKHVRRLDRTQLLDLYESLQIDREGAEDRELEHIEAKLGAVAGRLWPLTLLERDEVAEHPIPPVGLKRRPVFP